MSQPPSPRPGPHARAWVERDAKVVSHSYTRTYPLVVQRASGLTVEDVDMLTDDGVALAEAAKQGGRWRLVHKSVRRTGLAIPTGEVLGVTGPFDYAVEG